MIRPATLADLPALMSLAKELATTYYPRLRYDPSRATSQCRAAISSARHFAWVAEHNGIIVGALVAFVNDNFWAQRCNSWIVLWASSVAPYGAQLLRRYRQWSDERSIIKVSGFSPDIDVDPRVWHLAERLGYKRSGGAYLRYRGAEVQAGARALSEAQLPGMPTRAGEALAESAPGVDALAAAEEARSASDRASKLDAGAS
jgi:hypothetical protein